MISIEIFSTDINMVLYNIEKNLAPLCLYLAVILGAISFLNAIGIAFLIPTLLRYRYKEEDKKEELKKIENEIELTRLMSESKYNFNNRL